jgi:hypothetical protein
MRGAVLVCALVAVIASFATSSAFAYTLSSECHSFSNASTWCLSNGIGAHNWTQYKTQNWGTTNQGTSGYSASLGLAVLNSAHNVDLGHVFTPQPYPVERRGGPYFQFYWNFGNAFSYAWPIWMGVTQVNPENVQQWQWMWAYGP